nr:AEC family transporter [Enterocloster clostridioformis]
MSSVIINIFNPCLIISGVLNKKITYSPHMVAENLVLVAVFFLVLILLSRLFTKIMRLEPGEVNSYRLMMIFPNLGFMGIPLVRSLYGEEAVIFVAFYIVGYNLLVYSYGILLAMGTRDDIGNAGKGAAKRAGLPWKKMLNIGMGACIMAILIFAFHIRVPEPAAVFVDSMKRGSALIHDDSGNHGGPVGFKVPAMGRGIRHLQNGFFRTGPVRVQP